MGSTSLSDLTPDTRKVVEQLLLNLGVVGLRHKVVSTLRSCAEQHALFEAGTTRADGCRSWHVWGRAVDIMMLDDQGKLIHDGSDERYAQMGALAEQLGMVWGGRFNDPIHVEYHPGLTQNGVCPDPALCNQFVGTEPSQPQPPHPQPPSPDIEPVRADVNSGVGAVTWLAAFAVGAGLFIAVRHIKTIGR